MKITGSPTGQRRRGFRRVGNKSHGQKILPPVNPARGRQSKRQGKNGLTQINARAARVEDGIGVKKTAGLPPARKDDLLAPHPPESPSRWRQGLRRRIAWLLAFKFAALFALWTLFFSPAHRPEVNDATLDRALSLDQPAQERSR